MRPRLSIVVPFFDVGDEIGACLDSILLQRFGDFEVILVDDGSRDHSLDVARRFTERDARFRIVRQDNQGLGPARNTGMAEATGEYLTFVDSDDLVTRHGFERLIRSLDESGSSFAAGDARRFDSTGVRESWVHRVPFATDRRRTHVREFPALAVDRMIWNKVFRHDFWREHEFRFPAIRYEDYPVTLPAHVEAEAVDCLSAPVYFWRVRESGASITQLAYDIDNLNDRVTSAELVLDYVDAHAPALAASVGRHLAEIDVGTIVHAIGDANGADEDRLLALGQRLVGRLTPDAIAGATSFEQLQVHALRAGDGSFVQRLARFRAAGGLRGGGRVRTRAARRPRFERVLPGADEHPPRAPAALYRVDGEDLELASSVDDVTWRGDRLVVRGTAQIAHLATSASSRLAISLSAPGFAAPSDVVRFEATDAQGDTGMVGFEVEIGSDALAAMPTSVRLAAELRDGTVHRTAPLWGLRSGSPMGAPGRWIGERTWVQPVRGDDARLWITRHDDPWSISTVRIDGDHLELQGRAPRLPDRAARLTVTAGDTAIPVRFRYVRAGHELAFVARVALGPVVDGADPDDPVLPTTTWSVAISGDERTHVLSTDVTADVTTMYRGRMLRVTRTPGNEIVIVESPPHVVAGEVEVLDGDAPIVDVGGTDWGAGLTAAFAWRRLQPSPGDVMEVAVAATVSAGHWHASTSVAELLGASAGGDTVGWVLFAIDEHGDTAAVRASAHLAARLPCSFDHADRSVEVRPRSDMVNVEVRPVPSTDVARRRHRS